MPTFQNASELLEAVRERLDGWVAAAREQAYADCFEGPDALLTDEEVVLLDRIDSRLGRERGEGLWGADEYRIVPAGTLEEESAPRVVCTYHPRVPEYVNRSVAPLDEATRERLDDALWEYAQRVVELTQADVEAFVWSSEVATRAE
ncbi:MAG: hypothetical protein ABEJ23_01600 [Haloarculaceae archaeon]